MLLITKTIDYNEECHDIIIDMFSELESIDSKRKGWIWFGF